MECGQWSVNTNIYIHRRAAWMHALYSPCWLTDILLQDRFRRVWQACSEGGLALLAHPIAF